MPTSLSHYLKLIYVFTGVLLSLEARGDTDSFFINWFENVDKVQEEQPHWVSPLVTATPRLEQSFRYDITRQYQSGGVVLNNYGGNKGLKLITGESTEIDVSVPSYLQKKSASTKLTGWSDESLLLKYRILSANEEHGNYAVSVSRAYRLPSGDEIFTNHHAITTPTLAVGKGWGDRNSGFDIQSTLSASIPSGGKDILGIPVVFSTALQAHIGQVFWPEIEANYTHWEDGLREGKNQLVMTYGISIGRFTIENRVKAIFGLGYQAVQGTEFETFNHILLASARLSF